MLAIYGKNDSFFVPPCAEAFKRDVLNVVVKFLDTGNFALVTNLEDIASAILKMSIIEGVWLLGGLLAAA